MMMMIGMIFDDLLAYIYPTLVDQGQGQSKYWRDSTVTSLGMVGWVIGWKGKGKPSVWQWQGPSTYYLLLIHTGREILFKDNTDWLALYLRYVGI